MFTNSQGVQIFFPDTGEMYLDKVQQEHQGYYWTNSMNDNDNTRANCLVLFSDAGVYSATRYYGLCIRPVRTR